MKGTTISSSDFFYGKTESRPLLDTSTPKSDPHDPSDLSSILSTYKEEPERREKMRGAGGRVFIFPSMQMNVINVRDDEDVFLKLLKMMNA